MISIGYKGLTRPSRAFCETDNILKSLIFSSAKDKSLEPNSGKNDQKIRKTGNYHFIINLLAKLISSQIRELL